MLNFLILITKVHQGSSCSCCVGIIQSSDIKLHTAARWSVRHPVRCRRNGLDWPFSHCLLKHIKNSKINRHHSYCRVLLLSVFSARFCVRTNVNADAAVLWKMQNKPGSDWSWGRSLMSCSQSVLEGFRRRWRKRTELQVTICPDEEVEVKNIQRTLCVLLFKGNQLNRASSGPRARETNSWNMDGTK